MRQSALQLCVVITRVDDAVRNQGEPWVRDIGRGDGRLVGLWNFVGKRGRWLRVCSGEEFGDIESRSTARNPPGEGYEEVTAEEELLGGGGEIRDEGGQEDGGCDHVHTAVRIRS